MRLDLDTDLSDLTDPSRGRHPLPDPRNLVAALARAGIGEGTRVVAYDDAAGAVAVRLWWLLRWLGLKGCRLSCSTAGSRKWIAEERPVESGPAPVPAPHPRPLAPRVRDELTVSRDDVARARALGLVLLDARAPERYRGEVEPIDARAGHIPGAVNAPFADNLTADAAPIFRSPDELRAGFARLGVGPDDGPRVVCYCGSGVTACHDLLALELAGIRGARLYPGSWSEWMATPDSEAPPCCRRVAGTRSGSRRADARCLPRSPRPRCREFPRKEPAHAHRTSFRPDDDRRRPAGGRVRLRPDRQTGRRPRPGGRHGTDDGHDAARPGAPAAREAGREVEVREQDVDGPGRAADGDRPARWNTSP